MRLSTFLAICGTFCLGSILVVSDANASQGSAFDQTFEFGNDGIAEVRDVQISFAGVVLPLGSANRRFPVTHGTNLTETISLPVPDAATVRWVSGDGVSHAESLPIRALIGKIPRYHGFQFMFSDDHVDIYLLQRKNAQPPFWKIERTKVFTAPNEQAQQDSNAGQ